MANWPMSDVDSVNAVSRHSVTSYVFTCCTTETILVHCSQPCVIRLLPYTHVTAAIQLLHICYC